MKHKAPHQPRYDIPTEDRDNPFLIGERLDIINDMVDALHRLEIHQTIAESEDLQQKVIEVKSKVDYLASPK